jgi:hypothetical protein
MIHDMRRRLACPVSPNTVRALLFLTFYYRLALVLLLWPSSFRYVCTTGETESKCMHHPSWIPKIIKTAKMVMHMMIVTYWGLMSDDEWSLMRVMSSGDYGEWWQIHIHFTYDDTFHGDFGSPRTTEATTPPSELFIPIFSNVGLINLARRWFVTMDAAPRRDLFRHLRSHGLGRCSSHKSHTDGENEKPQ